MMSKIFLFSYLGMELIVLAPARLLGLDDVQDLSVLHLAPGALLYMIQSFSFINQSHNIGRHYQGFGSLFNEGLKDYLKYKFF